MAALPPRILVNHSGFYRPLRKALEDEGIRVDDCGWELPPDDGAPVLACVVWFYDCLRHPLKVWRLRRALRQRNIPLLAWNRDAPHYLNRKPWRLDLLDRFRLLDIYATHTLIDMRRAFADSVMYLPNAADIDTYNAGAAPEATLAALREADGYAWDVSFFGGMNGQRYKEDMQRERFFTALGERLQALGIRYCFREAEGMTTAEQVTFIRQSRINLNFGARCEYLAPVASGLPERCYGIPAVGGFLLCDRRTHARDDFTVGSNWAEFDGADDCVEQIRYWLTHFDLARGLAERCHHHVMQHHTYAVRARQLLHALRAWHDGQRGMLE